MPEEKKAPQRNRRGLRAGITGIIVNVCLFAAKLGAGIVSGAISLIADAVNNLSDALGGAVAAVGFRVAEKPADEKHPYGHARSEYIASLVLAVFMTAGAFELGKSSVERILDPQPMEISPVILAITLICVLAKIALFFFYRVRAREIDSRTLSAAATDSLLDAAATFAVFCGLLAQELFHLFLDAYLGLAVCLFMLVSSARILIESFDPLLGAPPEAEKVREIEEKILQSPEVLGVHDLVVHTYGANRCFVTAHIEVDASCALTRAHTIADEIERAFLSGEGITLTLHVDPVQQNDPGILELKEALIGFYQEVDPVLSVHDFRMARIDERRTVLFDLQTPSDFSVPDETLRNMTREFLNSRDPKTELILTIDRGYVSSL